MPNRLYSPEETDEESRVVGASKPAPTKMGGLNAT